MFSAVASMQEGPCAFVFQNPDNQIVMPTVASEVGLGTGEQKLTNEEVSKRVFAVLDKVNMAEFAEVSTGTLSGGQKQRTAIAAALAQGPPAPQVCSGCCSRPAVFLFSPPRWDGAVLLPCCRA
jgi:energy-coupling factor transporter ATP-binding protein EcfA2